MANTYTWKIDALDCAPTSNGQADVVTNVHWRVNGTDGVHNATVYGTQGIEFSGNTSFVPFTSLTQAEVITWVQTAMGSTRVAEIEANIDSQIAALANPPIVTKSVPWSA